MVRALMLSLTQGESWSQLLLGQVCSAPPGLVQAAQWKAVGPEGVMGTASSTSPSARLFVFAGELASLVLQHGAYATGCMWW